MAACLGLTIAKSYRLRWPRVDMETKTKNPIVRMEMDGFGTIEIELYPEIAPNTVRNFLALVQDGFYDGLLFHRVISGFMIQGGDPMGNGMGGPGYRIKGEFAQNGFSNSLAHKRGVISMARRSFPLDSAGSQFFIMHQDAPYLDGAYAAFGAVVSGMDVVDQIAAVRVSAADKPLSDVVMRKVTVDTQGLSYEPPVKIAE